MKGAECRYHLVDSFLHKAVLVAALSVAVSALSGCNTVKGIGHDITAVGEGGQDMINDATGNSTSARTR